jgi:hypothetical protein
MNNKRSLVESVEADRVEMIRHEHMKLCDLIKDLQGIYEIQLLVSLSGCFWKFLFNSYVGLFDSINTPFKFYSTKYLNNSAFDSLIWSFTYFSRFFFTTMAANYVTEEVRILFLSDLSFCIENKNFEF